MKYKVVFEEEIDGSYSVYIPQLPGCASQGETKRQAAANIRKALKLYLWSINEDQRLLAKRKVFIQDIAA